MNNWIDYADLMEFYCKTKKTSLIYFYRLTPIPEDKKADIFAWYEEFTDDNTLDMMKATGQWDIIEVASSELAAEQASEWFPSEENCPDADYYWRCYVMDEKGDFIWWNANTTGLTAPPT